MKLHRLSAGLMDVPPLVVSHSPIQSTNPATVSGRRDYVFVVERIIEFFLIRYNLEHIIAENLVEPQPL